MSIPLHSSIVRIYHAQKNILRPRMHQLGLSPGQPKLLRYLARHQNCIQRDLAVHCDIEPATVSRLLLNMEKQGLVTRAPLKDSRRSIAVSLTDKGRALEQEWVGVSHDADKESLVGFTEEEKQQFKAYLARMYQNIAGKPLE